MLQKLKIGLFTLTLGLIFILLFFLKPYFEFLTKTVQVSLIKTLIGRDSLKTFDDQINILLLGIGGGTHAGSTLSDALIVANYNFKTNQLTTISLPRDIWSETLRDKINSAYAYGEAKQKNGGFILAKAEVSPIVGMPIQYATVLNFSQFEELIDFLGGIDINVERSFTDKKFPIPGKEDDTCSGDEEYRCRYETIRFQKGIVHMNGKTALSFVRSRNAEGIEGTDFARSRRQQRVIEALKNKLFQMKYASLDQWKKLYSILDRLIIRDITNQQGAIMVKNIILKGKFVHKEVILTEEFFTVPNSLNYDGKYVLIPQGEGYETIHRYISCHLKNGSSCENIKKALKQEGE